MKRTNETRYIVTPGNNGVNATIVRIAKKSDAYRQATMEGWGIVCSDASGELYCDHDSSAVLVDADGNECCIVPYEGIDKKALYRQAECFAIICSDDGGFSFWEKEKGSIKICVSYDEDGLIDFYRLSDWTEDPEEGETVLSFDDLPTDNPYL